MFLQAVVPFLPSDLFVVLASMLRMDPLLIVLVSSLGSTGGGVVNYYLARRAGRSIILKMVGEKWSCRIEDWFVRWGSMAVVLTRAAPFLSSDAITYVAGAAGMRMKRFIPCSFLGATLRSLILVATGQALLNILPISF